MGNEESMSTIRDLNEVLDGVTNAIDKYHTCKIADTHTQSELARDLSANLHFLVQFKIEAHDEWMSTWFNSKGKSNAEKEREADFKVPHLYKIRQILSSGNKCLDAIRSTLSANK